MKDIVEFRVSEEYYKALQLEMDKRGLKSTNATAREILWESISGYSQKEQYLHSRIDQLEESIQQTLKVAIMSLMGSMIPMDMAREQRLKIKKQIEEHLIFLSLVSASIERAVKEGDL